MDGEVATLNDNEYQEPESWWSGQLGSLGVGLVAGLVFHFILNRYSTLRNLAVGADETMGNARSVASSASPLAQLSRVTDNKMVLVVRTDLGMTKGKAAAQCAHAAVSCYKEALRKTPTLVRQWEVFGQAKVALKTDSMEAVTDMKAKAQRLGLVACEVQDAGRTQVEAGSVTVLGVGPGPSELVDKVTGHLKLY
jgi:PTH2 family peptidyl-tRNA hydrolase